MTKSAVQTVAKNVNGQVSVRAATRTELITAQATTVKKASAKKRLEATNRDIVCNYISELMQTTQTLTTAVELLLSRADKNALPLHIHAALKDCAKGKSMYPSKSSLCEWHKKSRTGGVDALLPQHKGRQRQEGSWEALAVKLYNKPSKPTARSVWRVLTEKHFYLVSYAQVNNYLNSLPAQLGDNSPARIGKNLHRLTQQSFVRRTSENLKAGDVYVADGYRADVYLAHPITGDLFRPELTIAMDLKSRFIVGWRLDEHEGGFVVQSMWAETFTRHNHVPPFLYIDNGSGYKNAFMDDEIMGFYDRAGVVQIIHSIPGNPHGKGWVERFFRTMKEDFLKLWQPEFYCGDDMADEVKNKMVLEVKAKRLSPPSVQQFIDGFTEWLERYSNRPHPQEKDTTPKVLWSALVPVPPAMSEMELKRRQVRLTVRRASVTYSFQKVKTAYTHENLHAFNGQQVILEWDMMDNRIGIIRSLEGIWICDAHLVTALDAIPLNRLEAKRQQRASDAVKRLERKIDEQKARSGHVIDADAIADNANALIDDSQPAIPHDDEEPIILDLY